MATYMCYSELADKLLKYEDIIMFHIPETGEFIEYFVYREHLKVKNDEYSEKKLNDIIFKKLNLNKVEICTSFYEYKPVDNIDADWWPESKNQDYGALTRVVLELFRLLEEEKQLKETSEILFID